MKVSLVFLVAFCALAQSTPTGEHKSVDKVFLEKQKQVLELFYHINQPANNPHIVEVANAFSLHEHVDYYTKPEVVKAFIQDYKYDPLARGEIFSVFNEDHLRQAVHLFKVFYYAKDWESLYKTAAWARQHVNEGLFVYSFSVAIIHRPDTRGIVLPPIYEIYPHYFFSNEVLHKAAYYKQISSSDDAEYKNEVYTIDSNYSGWYLNLHPEQSMSYYLEDVGLSASYYYYNLYYPSWMSSEEFGWKDSKRGELYYYFYQQILARFYLERISNGFGEIPFINWDEKVETPYYPSLAYPNGLQFPSRPKFANLHEYFYNYGQKWTTNIYGYSHNLASDYERRINDAIDSGYVFSEDAKLINLYTEEGFNILGNIIQANKDSPNYKYYGPLWTFARHLLGYSYQAFDDHQLVPSALEHFETSMRDPVFYQLVKKVVLKFQRYYSRVPAYTEKDLVLPGVKVTKVEVDPLVTYRDHFYSELSNGVWYGPHQKHSLHIRVRQERLNHKPFSYKFHVKSDKEQKVSVKVFLGPKYDEYGRVLNLTENRLNMVELDHFVYDLKSGENVLTRNCYDTYYYAPDRVSYSTLYKHVTEAIAGSGEYKVDWRQNFFSWPTRYMLPQGSKDGVTYQFFVIVYPYVPYNGKPFQIPEYIQPGSPDIYVDNYSLGYPFDRFIKYEKLWYQIPNVYFQDEDIYYKDVQEINSPHH